MSKDKKSCIVLGPVVRRPISANLGLDVVNTGFFFFCLKGFSRIFFSFRASHHQIVGEKNKSEFAFQAFVSKFKFRTNPGLT